MALISFSIAPTSGRKLLDCLIVSSMYADSSCDYYEALLKNLVLKVDMLKKSFFDIVACLLYQFIHAPTSSYYQVAVNQTIVIRLSANKENK